MKKEREDSRCPKCDILRKDKKSMKCKRCGLAVVLCDVRACPLSYAKPTDDSGWVCSECDFYNSFKEIAEAEEKNKEEDGDKD